MADIKNYLKNQKAPNGQGNLFEHLTNIMGKVLLDNPKNAYDVFEDYSYNIKSTGYNLNEYDKHQNQVLYRESFAELKEWAGKAMKNLNKINLAPDGDEPVDPGPAGFCPNLPAEMKKLEWTGISFGAEETYFLHRSLTKLALVTKAKTVKLWGKILGSARDYYVAEIDGGENTLPDDEAFKDEPGFDARGSGINKLSYFVTNSVLDDWKELPLIAPRHIIQARRIKHICTGDLEANIITNPYFYGKEKHFLKAQILRITYGTTLAPLGRFKKPEDEASRDIEPTEEYVLPSFTELKKKESWVHFFSNILKEGKLSHTEDPDSTPEALELKKKKDPFEPLLKPIYQDKNPSGANSAWNIKTYGDLVSFDTVEAKPNKVIYGVIAIRSLVWPGAMTLFSGKTWSQFYLGYGHKADAKPFFPKLTQTIQAEAVEKEEQPEPNPKDPPAEPKIEPVDNNQMKNHIEDHVYENQNKQHQI